ncbi:MAG TPA: PQQ-dependent sugar dehydrogenase [Myxococcota bacterium]|nr:PQQ-dependent sugar dehydrogenase [Myxococcota bacterium]
MRARRAIASFGVGMLLIAHARAASAATPLATERVASGLSSPLFATYAPGDFTRLFIVEQTGKIRVLVLGRGMQGQAFLDLSTQISCCGELGLLGLAFHPDYLENGYLYVNYTNTAGNTVIERYRASGDPRTASRADPHTAFPILEIPGAAVNHRGGWIGFGPHDGHLYIATGDGAFGCDPGDRAQDTSDQLLGKILRIDVDGGTPYAIPGDNPFVGDIGDDEIWSYGLRNPFRCAFDSDTGDFYIADVGEAQIEEINIQRAWSGGGQNYGWDCMEGDQCSSASGCGSGGCVCNDPALTLPVYQYTHADGIAVTGGEVYRGCAIPDLDGSYFFADFGSARIWSFEGGVAVANLQERTAELAPGANLEIATISSFGRDAFGEIYLCDWAGGEVFKIVPDRSGPVLDCNENGVEDACDIASGASDDADGNGIPDDCVPASVPALSARGLPIALLCLYAGGAWIALRRRGASARRRDCMTGLGATTRERDTLLARRPRW